jgi:hypothetical protein
MEAITMINLIEKHNAVVNFLNEIDDVKIPMEACIRLMPLSMKLSTLGLELTREARAMGIEAKCNMQSGHITVYTK